MIKRKAKKMLKRFFTLKSLSSNGRTVFFQDINISSILIRLTGVFLKAKPSRVFT